MNRTTRRARGVKRTSKIAEVTTSKKKRAKKATAEAPEPDALENLFKAQHVWTEEKEKRSRLKEAAKDVAEGNLTLKDLTEAIRNACTERNLRLGDQGAFYNPPDQYIVPIQHGGFSAFSRSHCKEQRTHSRPHARRQATPFSEYQPWCVK